MSLLLSALRAATAPLLALRAISHVPGEFVSQREALKVVLIPQSKPDGQWGYARSGTSGKRQ